MNYEPNATHWQPGDLVVHDADAKEPRMLMKVIGYRKDGLCRTEYIDADVKQKWKRARSGALVNELRALHDPRRFGIEMPVAQEEPTRE